MTFSSCIARLILGTSLLLAGQVFAGGNEIYLKQDGANNRLVVDQSDASNSLVRGANAEQLDPSLDPALQTGVSNQATITITSPTGEEGGQVSLRQDGEGNGATINVEGVGALATVYQSGNDNSASLDVSGLNASGLIAQNADGNNAVLSIEGDNAVGSITQNGSRNETQFVGVGPQAAFDYTLNGDNFTTPSNMPVEVFTTGAGVTIVQTPLP